MITLKDNTRVSFEDITHSYLLDNEAYLMGVTTLMKKHGLSVDYSNIPEEQLNKAAERGSRIHKDIENYCNGNLGVVMTSELRAFIRCGIKWIANEYIISDNKMVASAIDIVADAGDGKVDLIDIKTTSSLHLDALSWQLSIYAYLFRHQNPDVEINKLFGLHIKGNKSSMVQVQRKPDSEIEALLQAEAEGLPFSPKTEELSAVTIQTLTSLEEISIKVAGLKTALKEAEELKRGIEQSIIALMETDTAKTLEYGGIKVTYIAPSEREVVDKTKLQADMPELYEKYKKVTPVAASVRISLK